MRFRLAPLLFFVAALPAWADSLPVGVSEALKNAKIPAASVAIVVQAVDASSPLLTHNARQAMNPASVMKLLTTYAALDLLGPAYTWKTEALADNLPAADGRLAGKLYLRGSGDPKFAIEHFSALLRQLRVRGVRHLAGDVILDRSAFNIASVDPGAFDDKPMRPYNVSPDALLINFQALRFTLSANNGRVQLLQETPSEGLVIDNKLQLGRSECGSEWKDALNVHLLADGKRLEFAGSFAAACGEKTLNLAPLPADAQVSGLFRALWKELGGSFAGQVRPGSTPTTAALLAQQESAALADSVRDINKFSNNVMARQLFLTLGNGNGPATVDKARQRVSEWLAGRGLKFDELEIENGSGLSRRERISADSLNRLLLDAWKSPVMPELVASLPIVGIDGTMKKRLKESEASGRAHIKTGSLDGVKSAAGFALNAKGRPVAVSFLINHPRAQLGQPAIDSLLLWVAQQ